MIAPRGLIGEVSLACPKRATDGYPLSLLHAVLELCRRALWTAGKKACHFPSDAATSECKIADSAPLFAQI